MKLHTLGGLELTSSSFARPKPLLLLTYLSCEGPKSRHLLSALFWPHAAHPATNLRMALRQLRSAAPNAILQRGPLLHAEISCDVVDFLRALQQNALTEARSLYRGPFLAGLPLKRCGLELEEWVYNTREYFAARMQEVLIQGGELLARKGHFITAASSAERALSLAGAPEPAPEDSERLYLLLRAGHNPRARQLRDETPMPDVFAELSTKRAQHRLRYQVSSHTPSAHAPYSITNAGEALIGRNDELEALSKLLLNPEIRLITLLGLGGIGKSRLALALAQHHQEHFPAGVQLIPLDTFTTSEPLLAQLAAALNMSNSSTWQQLTRHFATGPAFLVLDNGEQLNQLPELVSSLLHACPSLKILVTSRLRLHLEQAWSYQLQGLSYPDPSSPPELGTALKFDAIKFFLLRARRTWQRFQLLPETLPQLLHICHLVEGSPLGLELTAAWVEALPLAHIAHGLEHNPDLFHNTNLNITQGHRNLRTVFEHSWRLLNASQQRAYRRLAIFAETFSAEAAQQVANVSVESLRVLVEHALLQHHAGIYRHPLLLRYYLREKLEGRPHDAAKLAASLEHYTSTLQKPVGSAGKHALKAPLHLS